MRPNRTSAGRPQGFTLVEIMISVALIGLVGAVLIEGFTYLHRIGRSVQSRTDIHHVARMTFLSLSRDIREARWVGVDLKAPGTLTLRDSAGKHIVYRQDGDRIIKDDERGVRTLAEGIGALRFIPSGSESHLIRVEIESGEPWRGRVTTHTLSLDIARRNKGDDETHLQ